VGIGIKNDNNISDFEEKITLIENTPFTKKSSSKFNDINSKKDKKLLTNKILSVSISLLLSQFAMSFKML